MTWYTEGKLQKHEKNILCIHKYITVHGVSKTNSMVNYRYMKYNTGIWYNTGMLEVDKDLLFVPKTTANDTYVITLINAYQYMYGISFIHYFQY